MLYDKVAMDELITAEMNNLGNVIMLIDKHWGEVYIPEANLVSEAEALSVSGEVKKGYLKFETATGCAKYTRDIRFWGMAGIVYPTEDGNWYVRSVDEPWRLIEDCEPENYGTLTAIHYSNRSEDVLATIFLAE